MLRRASILAAIIAIAGCGSVTTLQAPQVSATSSVVEAKAVPPQSAFKVVKATVIQLLPEDNDGLTHQNFKVKAISPDAGRVYEVNNSTTHGSKVPNLKVGDVLEIRGTTYQNKDRYGLHWTHKADKSGDAGYIKTADGKIYE
ncbi:MAG TPA: DUF3465 domain-containing protein [Pantanalinema sp.]